jgi:sulfatase maturation enzyme AslB (radical SAM superfamily)
MTLAEAQKIFPPEFLQQLALIEINGNFGDIVMSLHTLDIVEYFKRWVPASTNINISTNGGARDRAFWTKLAELDIEVFFCLDGLEDTHHLYRQNTLFSTVIKNAKAFIDAGGRAGWKMIVFEHNQHQVDACRELSKQLGFAQFFTIDQGRDYGPVYNSNGDLVHVMKPDKWLESTDFATLFKIETMPEKQWSPTFREKKIREWTGEIKPIACEVKKTKSIYVSSVGDVYPCCYMGFSPKTFKNHSFKNHHNWMGWANAQVAELISENNALEHGLEHCMQWFSKVSKSWEKPTYEEGRLSICNQTCGKS